jgi:hypothetical protein
MCRKVLKMPHKSVVKVLQKCCKNLTKSSQSHVKGPLSINAFLEQKTVVYST